jgi:PBSX family phage terminase large subunit
MKKTTQQISWQQLPKQAEFIASQAREVLYSGAFGSGKTRATCMKLVLRASRRGACEALVRKHLVTLKATSLRTLLEPEGSLPPVLPAGTYEHNKSEKIIRIHGGGQILYFGLDDAGERTNTKRGSYNLSGVGIDQAEELTESDYIMLRGRIRATVEGMPNQIYGACNPDSDEHHLAKRFGFNKTRKAAPGTHAIQTASADNFLLPADYLADLNTLTGIFYRRYVLGEWCAADGAIYETFTRDAFVCERDGVPWVETICGVDWGMRNPTALLVVRKDEQGGLHVQDEFYRPGLLEPEIVEVAKDFRTRYAVTSFAVDPSALALRETMSRAGLLVIEANNDVLGGISRVSKRFVVDGTGRPLLTISPSCIQLIRELGLYCWDGKKKDKPKKENDHAADALRYGVMHFDSGFMDVGQVRLLGERKPAPRDPNQIRDDSTSNDPRIWSNSWRQDGDGPWQELRARLDERRN